MARSVRHRNAPVERRSRDRHVLEAALDERDDLVTPLGRGDEVGLLLVELEQPILIRGKPEEVARLFDPFHFGARWCELFAALALDQFVVVEIGLVADRVPPLVGRGVDVAIVGLGHAAPNLLARLDVPLLRRADEVVVGDIQGRGQVAKTRGIAVGEGPRAKTLALRGLHHLETMLVGAGKEEHVPSLETAPAGDRIGRHHLVGVPDMRLAIGVRDRGGDIVGVAGH